jgi:exonuclease SbcC
VGTLPALPQTAQNDLASLQAQVETIRQTLIRVRQAAQDGTAVLAAARTKQEASERQLAEREQHSHETKERFTQRFPGFSSLGAALQALQTQRQELTTTLQTIEEKTKAVETQQQSVTQHREKAQREEATLTETLRGIGTRLESLTTQHSELAQSLTDVLSTGGNPEATLTAQRHALSQVEHETKTAETQLRTAENALAALTTQQVKHEGTLGVFCSQHETAEQHVASEAQAVRENLSLTEDTTLPEITELESELTTCARKHEQLTNLHKRLDTLRGEHEHTQRQVVSLQADLHARERILRDTQDKRVQAEQLLENARTDLQTAVQEHGLSDISADGAGLPDRLVTVRGQVSTLREQRGRLTAEIVDLERRCVEKEREEEKLHAAQTEEKLAAELRKLLGAGFTDFLSQGAVEALMRDASVHLQRLTNGRYSFDIAYKGRSIELQIVDHEDHRRTRPTHSLSGGETFLASLAIALALSQGFRAIATGKAAQTSTECLILDEGFGTLDREGLQLVTETLQELRGEEGRIVGIITHVEEVAAAMPMRVDIHKSSRSSTISVSS